MSVETGATGVDYEYTCPICGKEGAERSKYCLKPYSSWECPNMNESCGKRSKTHTNRRNCAGYSTGHIGTGANLRTNIMGRGIYKSKKINTHPLYTGNRTIEAHHLISSDLLKNPKWKKICEMTGYNVNCWLNGIFLPSRMIVACHAHLQRHKGDHELGSGNGNTYVKSIKTELDKIISKCQQNNKSCDEQKVESVVKSLNRLSNKILKKIIGNVFTWTIAWDGFNYQEGGIGCANSNDIDSKRKTLKNKLEKEMKQKGISDTFVQTGQYSFNDMSQLREFELDSINNIMCDMNRIHTSDRAKINRSRELTSEQVAKFTTFIREIGY